MSRPAGRMPADRDTDRDAEIDVTDRRTTDRRATDRHAADRARPIADDRQPVVADGNGTAIAALITGLLAATFGFLVATAPAAILFGLVAIVLGVKGMGRAKSLGGLHKGLAVSGLVSGILGLLLGIAVVVGGVTLFSELQERAEQGDLPAEIQQPVDDLTGG